MTSLSLSLDFRAKVREKLGDFRKSIQILTFLSPLPHVPLPFIKRTCCTMILKRMQLTSLEYNIEHQILCGSNFRNMGAPFMWILKKKYDYWWKKYRLEKTDRATKTSLFDRNWAISLKPRRRSRPLRLVWWALHGKFFMKPLYNVGWLLVTNTYLIKCAQCISRITIIEYDHSQKIGQPNKLKGYYVWVVLTNVFQHAYQDWYRHTITL